MTIPALRSVAAAVSVLVAGVMAAGSSQALAGEGASLGDWPQFHGPLRDNISTETGLLKQWPAEGPRLVWKSPECGAGYAGPAIAGGRVFLSGDFAELEAVIALDANGTLLWKTVNGKSWKGPYPGARTTPTCDNGTLYHMNPHGRLAALAAADGREVWAVDLGQRFGAKPSMWAMAENVILDGNAVLCAPGGPRGRVAALDKATGRTIWANTDIDQQAAYCSPIIFEHNGVRQYVTIMQNQVVSVDVRTGKLLWTHPHQTKGDQNVTMPLYTDGKLYVSSGHGTGGRLLQIAPDSRSVRQLWVDTDQDNCHGGVILRDGCLFGHGCRLTGKGFVCVELTTGKTAWNEKALGKVSLTWADGLFYCINDKALVSLVEAGPAGCRVVSKFNLPRGKSLTLSHPVICGKRLYIRHWNDLFAFDLAAAGK